MPRQYLMLRVELTGHTQTRECVGEVAGELFGDSFGGQFGVALSECVAHGGGAFREA